MVQSNVNYVLPTNLLNLTGTGTAAISLTGNASADTITANSGADTLIAGSGLATLIGGSGNDTFVINNASRRDHESANTGNNTEQTSVTATLAANVQNLTATGTSRRDFDWQYLERCHHRQQRRRQTGSRRW